MMTDVQNVRGWLEELSEIVDKVGEDQKLTELDYQIFQDRIKKIKEVFGNVRI